MQPPGFEAQCFEPSWLSGERAEFRFWGRFRDMSGRFAGRGLGCYPAGPMGLLSELTASQPGGHPDDVATLRDLISAVVISDGSVDVAEHLSVEALHETVPQLRGAAQSTRPPIASRATLLAQLAKVADDELRRQLFVIAVDLALSSEGASEREDTFIAQLQRTLELGDSFARETITVLAYKYARAR